LEQHRGAGKALRYAAALFEHEGQIDAPVDASPVAALFIEGHGSNVVSRHAVAVHGHFPEVRAGDAVSGIARALVPRVGSNETWTRIRGLRGQPDRGADDRNGNDRQSRPGQERHRAIIKRRRAISLGLVELAACFAGT
jgi:hypothetical protein